MNSLRQSDWRAMLACVHALAELTDPATLSERAVKVLEPLVPSDILAITEVDPVLPVVRASINRAEWENSELLTVLGAHIHEHPVVVNYHTTGNGQAMAVSELVSRRDFRRLALFNEVYRVMGVEDQLSIGINDAQGRTVGVSFSRSGWGFTRRDRAVLDLLRPHFLRAYQNAERMAELRARAGQSEDLLERLGQGFIFLSRTGRVAHVTRFAQKALERFFPAARPSEELAPRELIQWAQRAAAVGQAAGPAIRIYSGNGQRLIARACAGATGEPAILLTVQPAGGPAAGLRSAGLTEREAEIMRCVIEGKTNPQIGSALHISPRTVQKHLENIFRKLGVETRTGAVARAIELSTALT